MSRSAPRHQETSPLTFQALTFKNWGDLETLFGPRGACGGCWCMFWRVPRAQFNQQKGEGNKRAFRKRVRAKAPLGILAYAAEQPVA